MAIGLTGGIATGKSEVGRILARRGWTVLDADQIAKDQMVPGHPVFDRVIARFGRRILGADGMVDRAALGRLVFSDEDERSALNGITHPPVMDEIRDRVMLARARGETVVVQIPLLYEVGAEKEFDAVLCVTAPDDAIRARLRARGLSDEEADRRMAAQWPNAEKARRADAVIENDGDLKQLEERTMNVIHTLLMKENA